MCFGILQASQVFIPNRLPVPLLKNNTVLLFDYIKSPPKQKNKAHIIMSKLDQANPPNPKQINILFYTQTCSLFAKMSKSRPLIP